MAQHRRKTRFLERLILNTVYVTVGIFILAFLFFEFGGLLK